MPSLATLLGSRDGRGARLIQRGARVSRTPGALRLINPETAPMLDARLGARVRLDDSGVNPLGGIADRLSRIQAALEARGRTPDEAKTEATAVLEELAAAVPPPPADADPAEQDAAMAAAIDEFLAAFEEPVVPAPAARMPDAPDPPLLAPPTEVFVGAEPAERRRGPSTITSRYTYRNKPIDVHQAELMTRLASAGIVNLDAGRRRFTVPEAQKITVGAILEAEGFEPSRDYVRWRESQTRQGVADARVAAAQVLDQINRAGQTY